MDFGSINNLNSKYMTDALNKKADQTARAAKDAASKDYSGADDKELMDVCKQFESYFIEQVLKEVKKTVPDTSFSQDSSTQNLVDYFMDETLQKVSENIQSQAGLGLAQQMYEQMKRNYSPAAQIPPVSGGEEA
jgi:flagellar protein FlgJ